MNKIKLKIEDWVLYDTEFKGCIVKDAFTGQDFNDLKPTKKEIRVVGTKQQLLSLESKYNIDEIYSYKEFKKNEYDTKYYNGICWSDNSDRLPTLKEYNKKYHKTYDRYYKLYVLNNKKPLILNIN
tara:strand:+ start:896 stop:1273 length:378 start_codon:yes stop_codon:yes gene_type:complete